MYHYIKLYQQHINRLIRGGVILLRIGVIGAGLRSQIAVHWQREDGRSRVVAVADPNDDKLALFKERVGEHVMTTKNYEEILADANVDAVAILTPDFLHEEHILAALEAGKHVYAEKPLAITTEGCDRIIAAQKRTNKKVMIGFNMRYMSMYQTMKELIDNGTIGDVKAVWVRHFVGMGGYFYYHDWHAQRKNTTSLLLQKASHDFDVIHWITGRYTEKVVGLGSLDYFGGDEENTLTCPNCAKKHTCPEYSPHTLTQCAFREEVDVEDNNVVIMQLEGGIKASYLQCHFTPDYSRNYVFIGTKGRIESNDVLDEIYVKTRKTGDIFEMSDATYKMKKEIGGHGGVDPKITEDFVNYVLDDKEPHATLLDGRMSVAVGCAATASIRQGGVIQSVN